MGLPDEIKTDNGPAYASRIFTDFCREWQIQHTTGIPYNPQGQAIVERVHGTLKKLLLSQLKNKKGGVGVGTPLSRVQQTLLTSLFTLNFLNLPQNTTFEPRLSRAEKHFSKPAEPQRKVAIWVKVPGKDIWEAGMLISLGRGYACVILDGEREPIWVPLRLIRPRIINPDNSEHPAEKKNSNPGTSDKIDDSKNGTDENKKQEKQEKENGKLPTWRQVETLIAKGQQILVTTGKPKTLENLFLAVLVLMSCASKVSANHTYWAYIPHPPLLGAVDWGQIGPIVFTNDSKHMPGPWTREGPAHPEEEGRNMNITVGYDSLPLCVGLPPCLPIKVQVWAYVLPATPHHKRRMGMYTAWSFRFNHLNSTEVKKPNLDLCEQISYRNYIYTPVHWTKCRGMEGKLMKSGDYTYLDWGPSGQFLSNCSEDFNSSVCDYTTRPNWNTSSDHIGTIVERRQFGLTVWYDGGLSGPRPRLQKDNGDFGPEQWDLWKLPASLHPLKAWHGSFTGTENSMSHYWFRYNASFYIQACVKMPYVIAIGVLRFNYSLKSVTCSPCAFYTCLNAAVPFNKSRDSILVMRARTHVWLPVRLHRPWEESPATGLMLKVLRKLLRRSKRFIGWAIVALVGLIAITATAATAGEALQQTAQTRDYVQNWTEASHTLWNQQVKVDEELEQKIGELQQAVQWLGDQFVALQQQILLHCDWNTSEFCITPVKADDAIKNWDSIKYHLQGITTNISLDVHSLQQEVVDSFSTHLSGSSIDSLVGGISSALVGMDPQAWFQSITHVMGGSAVTIAVIGFLVFICYCCVKRSIDRSAATAYGMAILFNKKGGAVGGRPRL